MLFAVASVAAYFAGVVAADTVTPRAVPRATVNGLYVDPAALDLGEVWEHPQHVIRFKVVNDSGTSKVVERFAGSCGCTTIEPQGLTLPPGGSAELTATIDLTERSPQLLGVARRPLRVEVQPVFAGDLGPTPGWTLTGAVLARVGLDVKQLIFLDNCVHGGAPRSRRFHVTAHLPLDRVEAEADPANAAVRVEPAGEGRYAVVVAPNPALPAGPFKFPVAVRAVTPDGVAHPAATVEVSGEMHPAVQVFPRTVFVGEVTVPGPAVAEVTVTLPAGWAVVRVETDAVGARVEPAGPSPDGGTLYRFSQPVTLAGDFNTRIRFVVRDHGGTTQAIPVQVRGLGRATGQRGGAAMNRHLWAVLLIGAVGTTAAQPKADSAALSQVLDGWKSRQSKFKTARYAVSGTVEYVADKPGDLRPLRLVLVLDLENSRFRLDYEDEGIRKGKFVRLSNIRTYDGKETRIGQPRDLAQKNKGFDLIIAKNAPDGSGRQQVPDTPWPLLYAHGIVPTLSNPVYVQNLRRDPIAEEFVGLGRRSLRGRPHDVFRTEPQASTSAGRDEFWVDLSRDAAISQHVQYAGGEPQQRLEIEWRQTDTGWWPERWTCTITPGGKTTDRILKCRVESLELDGPVSPADFTIPAEPGMDWVEQVTFPPSGQGLDKNRLAYRKYRITESGEWVETDAVGFATQDGIQLPPEATTRPGWHYAVAGIGVIVILIFCYRAFRRRRLSA